MLWISSWIFTSRFREIYEEFQMSRGGDNCMQSWNIVCAILCILLDYLWNVVHVTVNMRWTCAIFVLMMIILYRSATVWIVVLSVNSFVLATYFIVSPILHYHCSSRRIFACISVLLWQIDSTVFRFSPLLPFLSPNPRLAKTKEAIVHNQLFHSMPRCITLHEPSVYRLLVMLSCLDGMPYVVKTIHIASRFRQSNG